MNIDNLTMHAFSCIANFTIIIILRFVGLICSVVICTIIQVITNGALPIISQQSRSTANIMHKKL